MHLRLCFVGWWVVRGHDGRHAFQSILCGRRTVEPVRIVLVHWRRRRRDDGMEVGPSILHRGGCSVLPPAIPVFDGRPAFQRLIIGVPIFVRRSRRQLVALAGGQVVVALLPAVLIIVRATAPEAVVLLVGGVGSAPLHDVVVIILYCGTPAEREAQQQRNKAHSHGRSTVGCGLGGEARDIRGDAAIRYRRFARFNPLEAICLHCRIVVLLWRTPHS